MADEGVKDMVRKDAFYEPEHEEEISQEIGCLYYVDFGPFEIDHCTSSVLVLLYNYLEN